MATTRLSRRAAAAACLCGLVNGCAAASHSARRDALAAQIADVRHPPPAAASLSSPLRRDELIAQVLARSPGLASARETVRAALARHARTSALPDPMLEYAFAPLSIGSSDVSFGQEIKLRQALPFPGKRDRAAEVALWEAEAEAAELSAMRSELVMLAWTAFDAYFANARRLEVNARHAQWVEEARTVARARAATAPMMQDAVLGSEVELARIAAERVTLQTERETLVARINALRHEPVGSALPPPPQALQEQPPRVADERETLDAAVARRPELLAQTARVQAATAAIASAERDYYPDFGLMAGYSSMWMDLEHRFMLGIELELPLQIGARDAAVDEARAMRAQAQAQWSQKRDEVSAELAQAEHELQEAVTQLELLHSRLLPLSRARIDAARAAYASGQGSIEALIVAERDARATELDAALMEAERSRRQAMWLRARGAIDTLAASQGGVP